MRLIHHTPSTLLATFILIMTCTTSFGQATNTKEKSTKNNSTQPCCTATNQPGPLTCKLSSTQLMKRKETVLKKLKQQIIESKELADGYAFKFPGTDKVLDELNEFIKTERTCCDFFIFGLSVSGDGSEAWLSLTGPEGAKDFISSELGLVE